LVSLFLGKLLVGSHKRAFDLAGQEALILPQDTSFSAIKVPLVSLIYVIIKLESAKGIEGNNKIKIKGEKSIY